MLEGITILNEYPIVDYEFNFLAGAIAAIIVFTVLCIVFGHEGISFDVAPFIALILIAAATFSGVGAVFVKKVPTSAKEYQVTIEDYVSINDVYDYYEIVDKEGDIWTIRKLIDEI